MSPLDDLIQRLTRVVNDTEIRPVLLHWSDVELLRAVQAELIEARDAMDAAHRALDEALRAAFSRNPERPTP